MKLTERQEKDLLVSLEAKGDILPYLSSLLEDLWELGSSPSLYVDMLRPLNPDRIKKALDLGTGKGAVAITLAQELGISVLGVDLYEPFLKEAKIRAEELGVTSLCRFIYEDIHQTVKKSRDYDLVIFVSLGGVLGDFKECVGQLRETVHPGGLILIDDGFLKEGQQVEKKGYEHYASHGQTLKNLSSFGDILIQEFLYTDKQTSAINWGYLDSIKKRAHILVKEKPEIAEVLDWYIQNQEDECRIIEESITGACWLLQRSD